MMNVTTTAAAVQSAPSRMGRYFISLDQALAAFDAVNEPTSQCHMNSMEWDGFLAERARIVAEFWDQYADGPDVSDDAHSGSDVEYIEFEAARYDLVATDAAAKCAEVLRSLAAEMTSSGVWTVAELDARRAAYDDRSEAEAIRLALAS